MGKIYPLLLASLSLLGCTEGTTPTSLDYPNLIDYHFTPKDNRRTAVCLSDQGSWMGICLPEEPMIGATGPYLLNQGQWAGKWLSRFSMLSNDSTNITPTDGYQSNSYPGLLEISAQNNNIRIESRTFFVSSTSYLHSIRIINLSDKTLQFRPVFDAALFSSSRVTADSLPAIAIGNGRISYKFDESFSVRTEYINDSTFNLNGELITIAQKSTRDIALAVTYLPEVGDMAEEQILVETKLKNPVVALQKNRKRWNDYLSSTIRSDIKGYDFVPVKCLQTLITNWKSPLGNLQHSGVVPSMSVSYFYGFWAWDSWKHAVALSHFNPDLAKEQIRAMFQYQDSAGMVADCVYPNPSENNWRDTKPPLAAWAIWTIFQKTGDTDFLKEITPALEKYHRWWYANRDHNKNGLCEYGSTDGTVIAAKWESGMDNAVRFDTSKLVQNNPGAWSLTQESVDLNAYLYLEKDYLSHIYQTLGNAEKAAIYKQEAENLSKMISNSFYDNETGFFFDRHFNGQLIKSPGPEGWIPLWAGAADSLQASRIVQFVTQKSTFGSYIPFPTITVTHPAFDIHGYWRGPVWLDQAYFAIAGLRNYGYKEKADSLSYQLFNNLQGLKGTSPIFENYDPHTGKGLNAPSFSWSAAHLLLTYLEVEK